MMTPCTDRFARVTMTAMTALLISVSAAYAESAPELSELTPIPLKAGLNRVPQFSSDGREATILLGWRDNGNAHGYDLFVVTMPSRQGGKDTQVVGIDEGGTGGRFNDVIRDQPHTGEDIVRFVRFARGMVNGKPSTLLLTATRDIAGAYPEPAFVDFVAYRLERSDGAPGATVDYFAPIARFRSEGRYCNAEMALSAAFNVPLRTGYQGPKQPNGQPTPDGCFHDRPLSQSELRAVEPQVNEAIRRSNEQRQQPREERRAAAPPVVQNPPTAPSPPLAQVAAPPVTPPAAFGAAQLGVIIETSQTNAARFARDFKGKNFRARLTFNSLEDGFFGQKLLTASAGNLSVTCVGRSDLAKAAIDWRVGDAITVNGVIDDTILGALMLDPCAASK
jgi:hypothetical protein